MEGWAMISHKQPILAAMADGLERDTQEIARMTQMTTDTAAGVMRRLVQEGIAERTHWGVNHGRTSEPARWRLMIPQEARKPAMVKKAPPQRKLSELEQRWRDSGLGCAGTVAI